MTTREGFGTADVLVVTGYAAMRAAGAGGEQDAIQAAMIEALAELGWTLMEHARECARRWHDGERLAAAPRPRPSPDELLDAALKDRETLTVPRELSVKRARAWISSIRLRALVHPKGSIEREAFVAAARHQLAAAADQWAAKWTIVRLLVSEGRKLDGLLCTDVA